MATVTSYAPINLVDPSTWTGQLVSASSTQFVVSDGYNQAVYSGYGFSFYGNYLVGGTLTGFSQYQDGYQMGSITGFSMSATQAADYIQANNLAGMLSIALSRGDKINGSDYADKLAGYDGNDTIRGYGGDDTIYGDGGNDYIDPGTGSNYVDGGTGTDTVDLVSSVSNFLIRRSGGTIEVRDNAGTIYDTLVRVERLHFSEGTLAFDTDGTAGQTYRLYQAAFNRTPDKGGLSAWVNALENGGWNFRDVAAYFAASDEFRYLYGSNLSNSQFVARLYQNVLHRDGDPGGFAYWVGQLDSGINSRGDVLLRMSDSPENKAGVAAAISDGIWLT
ncbi:DUF4214 domain-containing protein [Rhizobium oryzicola]|uniref:DUF4214 domain-containing protein n=1 Tax=Rhizobium oryzicola TaxID=1232668 RepID=A0ABT8T0G7_9HYPH|nr:DUF4214 domain-containing protein [Rhizobium oryzicola]MDO1584126.1 DUF4214 domain-containing protein [Rhizobium oryzicola]